MKYLLNLLAWFASPMGLFCMSGYSAAGAVTILIAGNPLGMIGIIVMVLTYYLGMLRLKDLITLNVAHNLPILLKQYELQRKAEEHTDIECRDVTPL